MARVLHTLNALVCDRTRWLHCTAMATPDPFGLEPDSLPATASTVTRIESALVDAACGGESWRDIPLQGELVRAYQSRSPDVAAAKTLLAALAPDRYGGQAGQSATVIVVTDPATLRAAMQHKSQGHVIEHDATPEGFVGRPEAPKEDTVAVATHPPTSISG